MVASEFYEFLKSRSKKKLPGREAQMKMSPVPLDPDVVLPRRSSDTAHPSSVLIALFPEEDEDLHVIFTLRTESIRHAGQISFPGGRTEGGESLIETALRETEEEVGIKRTKIEIACNLTPLYLHRTDNQITPYVGFLEKRPHLKPNPAEVKEAFTTPIRKLVSEENFVVEKWKLSNAIYKVPYWNIHSVPLWGATAMMMSELLELFKEYNRNKQSR